MGDGYGHVHTFEGTAVNDEDDYTYVPSPNPSVLPHEYAAKDLDRHFPEARKAQPSWLEDDLDDDNNNIGAEFYQM